MEKECQAKKEIRTAVRQPLCDSIACCFCCFCFHYAAAPFVEYLFPYIYSHIPYVMWHQSLIIVSYLAQVYSQLAPLFPSIVIPSNFVFLL